ncbi:hypothetical protein BY996DRAFT_7476628 [Phakopsora pachyrhizi]|nr:hypothetical protein BY996DRAFT_8096996 [Phakopsora pachyrhizi]KAI8449506.1 hypothetical protein BY996DRAFT_7476628 [Phakopsora pachyrhizi]
MRKKLPSLVAKRAAYIENWGMARSWSYTIYYCPFLVDLWLNPIYYGCSVPISGYIQFFTAFVDQYVVVTNLLLILMTHMWFYALCIDISC